MNQNKLAQVLCKIREEAERADRFGEPVDKFHSEKDAIKLAAKLLRYLVFRQDGKASTKAE
jgi:hypothetical protein